MKTTNHHQPPTQASNLLCLTLALLATIYCQASLDDGLLAWYPLDGNGLDYSTNGLHGIVVDAIPATDRFGNTNGAMFFDGNGAFIWCGDALRPPQITMSLWFKAVRGWEGSLIADDGFRIRLTTTNGMVSLLSIDVQTCTASNSFAREFTTIIDIDHWHHAAFTFDGSNLFSYIDGKSAFGDAPMKRGSLTKDKDGTVDLPSVRNHIYEATYITNTFTNAESILYGKDSGLSLGKDGTRFSGYFRGAIDDVRLYSRPLGGKELQRLCENAASPSASSPAWKVSVETLCSFVDKTGVRDRSDKTQWCERSPLEFCFFVSNCVAAATTLDCKHKNALVGALSSLVLGAQRNEFTYSPGLLRDSAMYSASAVLDIGNAMSYDPNVNNALGCLAASYGDLLLKEHELTHAHNVVSQALTHALVNPNANPYTCEKLAWTYIDACMIQQNFGEVTWLTGVVDKLMHRQMLLSHLMDLMTSAVINSRSVITTEKYERTLTSTCQHNISYRGQPELEPRYVSVYAQKRQVCPNHLSFSPCGRLLACADYQSVIVYDLSSGRQIIVTNMLVGEMAFSRYTYNDSCDLIITVNNSVSFYDPMTMTKRGESLYLAGKATSFGTSRSRPEVLLADESCTLTFIKRNSSNCIARSCAVTTQIVTVAVSDDGTMACSFDSYSGDVCLWRLPDMEKVSKARVDWQHNSVRESSSSPNGASIAFSSDARYILTVAPDGRITLLAVPTLTPVRILHDGGHWLAEANQFISLVSSPNALQIWDITNRQIISEIKTGSHCWAISLSHDGSMCAVAYDYSVMVGACSKPLTLACLTPSVLAQRSATFDVGCNRIFSLDEQGGLNIWDLSRIANGPNCITGSFLAAALSPYTNTLLLVTPREALFLDTSTLKIVHVIQRVGRVVDEDSTADTECFVSFIGKDCFIICSPYSIDVYDQHGILRSKRTIEEEMTGYARFQRWCISPSNRFIAAYNRSGPLVTLWDLRSLKSQVVPQDEPFKKVNDDRLPRSDSPWFWLDPDKVVIVRRTRLSNSWLQTFSQFSVSTGLRLSLNRCTDTTYCPNGLGALCIGASGILYATNDSGHVYIATGPDSAMPIVSYSDGTTKRVSVRLPPKTGQVYKVWRCGIM